MSPAQSGRNSTPPALAPLKARLSAKPRRRRNQGATMALIAALLVVDQPIAVSDAATKSCHGAAASAQAMVPAASATTPTRVVATRPKRRCASSRQATSPALNR